MQQLTEKPLKGKEIDASTSVEWPEIYFLDDLLFFLFTVFKLEWSGYLETLINKASRSTLHFTYLGNVG